MTRDEPGIAARSRRHCPRHCPTRRIAPPRRTAVTMDARGTGQALYAAAAALSESRVPSPDGAPRTMVGRGGVYCNRLEECCDSNCWPSIIVTFFLVAFFILLVLICLCKYCIKSLYESGWIAGRGERRGLLLHTARRDLPPPYHAVVHASYLPSYEECSAMQKAQLQQV